MEVIDWIDWGVKNQHSLGWQLSATLHIDILSHRFLVNIVAVWGGLSKRYKDSKDGSREGRQRRLGPSGDFCAYYNLYSN